jgi:hypothetical protein
MSRVYPEGTEDAIWALMCDGLGATAIMRKLAEADPPITMPQRSVRRYRDKLLIERGDPKGKIAPGKEVTAANAIRRRGLELADRILTDLEEREKHTAKDVDALNRLLRTVDDIVDRETKRNGKGAEPSEPPERRHDQLAPSRSALDRLAAEELAGGG